MLGGRKQDATVNGAVELAFQAVDVETLNANLRSLERRVQSTELVALGLAVLVAYLVVRGSSSSLSFSGIS